jgi:hypothetical protein
MIKNLIERQKAALVMGVIAVASLAFMGVGNLRVRRAADRRLPALPARQQAAQGSQG